MKTLILSLILITNCIFCFEWLDCRDYPMPLHEKCIFYEVISDDIYMDIPFDFLIKRCHYGDFEAIISHWQMMPDKPITQNNNLTR